MYFDSAGVFELDNSESYSLFWIYPNKVWLSVGYGSRTMDEGFLPSWVKLWL